MNGEFRAEGEMTIQIELIETVRLTICPFEKKHLNQRYVDWLNDREVVRYSEQRHKRHSIESCTAYWEQLKTSSSLYWAIEAKDLGQKHIGNITAHIDCSNKVADVGILLGEKSIWGQGYGREAFGAVCNFLLAQAGIRKVTAGTMAANLGMRGIMRQLGMRDDGYRKNHFLLDGKQVDAVYGALYRADD